MTRTAQLALLLAGVCSGGCKSDQTKVVGYLDIAATTVVIYKSEADYKSKRRDACISGTIYPQKAIGDAVRFVGKKVEAHGYVVKEDYYLSQQGDEIAQMISPIQNLCRNDNVITIVKLAQAKP
jgi:hypothetical protein